MKRISLCPWRAHGGCARRLLGKPTGGDDKQLTAEERTRALQDRH